MISNYDLLSPLVEDLVMREKPVTILEISGDDFHYGGLFADCQKRLGIAGGKIVYMRSRAIYDIYVPETYDFIFIHGVLEYSPRAEALALLGRLQYQVTKQILIITPEYIPDKTPLRREYHPLTFTGLDFSYWLYKFSGGNWQFYSFFKKRDYEPLPVDDIAAKEIKAGRKMRIAFILPHKALTGGLKAILHQMRRLSRRGHIIKAYLRIDGGDSVIPDWSDLRPDEISEQIIVPLNASYLDYIRDVDVIFSGWLDCVPQLQGASVPVVLWEQGFEYLFGDYGELIDSSYHFRNHMAEVYRTPVHLLSVSPFISDILLKRYNRKSVVFPPYVDTELYFPWQKNDEMPPVLLVGRPNLAFKGFDFAFEVLKNAWERGARFTVWWAYQVEPEKRELPFPINYYYMLTPESLALLFRFAYVYLSTSLFEAFSLPPLEAMASGTPVLATDNGGIWAYAKPGENCLLCEQGDLEGMTERLMTLLGNPALRRRLGAAGRETALSFNAGHVTDKIEQTLMAIAFAEN